MTASSTAAAGTRLQLVDGKFVDERWTNGRWDLSQFAVRHVFDGRAVGRLINNPVAMPAMHPQLPSHVDAAHSHVSRCTIIQGADGKTDWDAVIDAEMERRRLLENSPIPATNDEPVTFDTAEIPWYATVL